MGYIGQDEDHLESPRPPSCDSLQTSNPMQSSGVTIPGIDDPLGVVADAQGQPPLCDVLPDHELVQVGNQRLGGRDEGEVGFLSPTFAGKN